jgi:hypothetical protein
MTILVKIMVSILIIGFGWPLISQLFDFFNIEEQTYGSYLAWFAALLLFGAILPKTKSSIFSE